MARVTIHGFTFEPSQGLTDAQVEANRLWITNLRSGAYRQGHDALRGTEDGVLCHCCLGVAEDCLPGGSWRETQSEAYPWLAFRGRDSRAYALTESAQAMLGLPSAYGIQGRLSGVEGLVCLDTLNDEQGFTFEMIADIVEAWLGT